MLSAEFWLTSLIVVTVPGTGVIYTVSMGLFRGQQAAVTAALGCTAGIVPHLLAGTLGLSLILHRSAHLFQTLKLAGVAYLLYLAWGMWQDAGQLTFDAEPKTKRTWQIIRRAVLINLLNPKLTLFFFAFLPLFVSADSGSPTVEMVLLSLIFMGLTLLVFMLYGVLASNLGRYVTRSPRLCFVAEAPSRALFCWLGAQAGTGGTGAPLPTEPVHEFKLEPNPSSARRSPRRAS